MAKQTFVCRAVVETEIEVSIADEDIQTAWTAGDVQNYLEARADLEFEGYLIRRLQRANGNVVSVMDKIEVVKKK